MGWKLGSFHLKGYTKKFYPQTDKLKVTGRNWMFIHFSFNGKPECLSTAQ